MRALCGAIITAGALIGLGFLAQGLGTRYHGEPVGHTSDGTFIGVKTWDIDGPLMIILVLLIIYAIVGITLAIIGLAYHHHRRHHELQRLLRERETEGGPRVSVG
jgi:hypothetical protein